MFTDMEYVKLDHTFCYTYELFDDIDEAKNNCAKQSHCGGIAQRNCDGNGPFYLCNAGTNYNSSSDECVYSNKGIKFIGNYLPYELYIMIF